MKGGDEEGQTSRKQKGKQTHRRKKVPDQRETRLTRLFSVVTSSNNTPTCTNYTRDQKEGEELMEGREPFSIVIAVEEENAR